jgi:hypothetical protein
VLLYVSLSAIKFSNNNSSFLLNELIIITLVDSDSYKMTCTNKVRMCHTTFRNFKEHRNITFVSKSIMHINCAMQIRDW